MDKQNQSQNQIIYYRKEAKVYDKKRNRENRCHLKKIDLIAKALGLKPDETVLEVGVGTGIHAKRLLETHLSLRLNFLGYDLSSEMIEQSKIRLANFPNVKLFVSPCEELPLKDSLVHKAYISGSLHHFANRRQGVKELVRIVKPGGIIAISEPNIFNPFNLWRGITEFKVESGVFFTHPKALKKLFSGLPVKIIEQKLFNFTPPFPEFAASLFDKIDNFLERAPFIRYIGSMSLIVVRKIY